MFYQVRIARFVDKTVWVYLVGETVAITNIQLQAGKAIASMWHILRLKKNVKMP